MRKLLTILFLFISTIALGQSGLGNPSATAWNRILGHLQVDHMVKLLQYASSDTCMVLGVTADGNLVLRNRCIGSGGGTSYTQGPGVLIQGSVILADSTKMATLLAVMDTSITIRAWVTSQLANIYTKSQVNDSLTAVRNTIATLMSNVYTKSQSDARYLQNYTETDPLWNAAKDNYLLKSDTPGMLAPYVRKGFKLNVNGAEGDLSGTRLDLTIGYVAYSGHADNADHALYADNTDSSIYTPETRRKRDSALLANAIIAPRDFIFNYVLPTQKAIIPTAGYGIREVGNVIKNDTAYFITYSSYLIPYQGNNVYVNLAYSKDGYTWIDKGQIISDPSEDPYMVSNNGTYYLYIENKVNQRNIKLYTSTDLSTWTDRGVILDTTNNVWENADVSSPAVKIIGDTFYMYYEGRGLTGNNGGAIGLAKSTDGITYTKYSNAPVISGNNMNYEIPWASEVVADDIAQVGDKYYIIMHCYDDVKWRSGIAFSNNKVTWTDYLGTYVCDSTGRNPSDGFHPLWDGYNWRAYYDDTSNGYIAMAYLTDKNDFYAAFKPIKTTNSITTPILNISNSGYKIRGIAQTLSADVSDTFQNKSGKIALVSDINTNTATTSERNSNLLFSNGSRITSDSTIQYDSTLKMLSITNSKTNTLTPAPTNANSFLFVNKTGSSANSMVASYNTQPGIFNSYYAIGGTATSPSATPASATAWGVNVSGWDGVSSSTSQGARMLFVTAEQWKDTGFHKTIDFSLRLNSYFTNTPTEVIGYRPLLAELWFQNSNAKMSSNGAMTSATSFSAPKMYITNRGTTASTDSAARIDPTTKELVMFKQLKYVDSIYRKAGSDSVYIIKNGAALFAYRDSIGVAGGGGSTYLANGTYTTVSGTGALLTPYVVDITTGIPAENIGDGSVSTTEYQYINTLSSNAQTQISSKKAANDSTATAGYTTHAQDDSAKANLRAAIALKGNGTVTSVTATYPIASTGGATPVISTDTTVFHGQGYYDARYVGFPALGAYMLRSDSGTGANKYITSTTLNNGIVTERTATATLTGKTIPGGSNTLTNIANASLTNSTISGVSLGGNLANLTAGTNITFSSGTTYNGGTAVTINASGGGGATDSSLYLGLNNISKVQWGWHTTITYSGQWNSGNLQVGTSTTNSQSWASTNLATRTPNLRYGSAATAGSSVTIGGSGQFVAYRGNSLYGDGFVATSQFQLPTFATTSRCFFGVCGSQPTNADPSSFTNIIGVGKDIVETGNELQIMYNDASGTATKVGTGIVASSSAVYRVIVEGLNNTGNVNITLLAYTATGVTSYTASNISTNLPSTTQGLITMEWINNGIVASSVALGISWVTLTSKF